MSKAKIFRRAYVCRPELSVTVLEAPPTTTGSPTPPQAPTVPSRAFGAEAPPDAHGAPAPRQGPDGAVQDMGGEVDRIPRHHGGQRGISGRRRPPAGENGESHEGTGEQTASHHSSRPNRNHHQRHQRR